MFLRVLSALACTALLASQSLAQQSSMTMPRQTPPAPVKGMGMPAPDPNKPLPSPAATANVMLGGSSVEITYNSPSMRGRVIMGGVVPYNKVWRTGANPATTIITPVALTIGTLQVPAGTYTLYTLPSSGNWMLIVNKQTGQWGTEYTQSMDLGRVPMQKKALSTPQDAMTISFDNTAGTKTELHVRWEMTDVFVPVTAAE